MGYILPEIYESACEDANRTIPKVFIETGTYVGGIPGKIMLDYKNLVGFDKFYTIELGLTQCQEASKKYKLFEEHDCNISETALSEADPDVSFHERQEYFNGKLTLINNDSTKALYELLPTINEPVCFWLDAHAGAQKYARGKEDVPLLSELEAIKSHHIKNHIIAIDDAHLFGSKQYDKEGNMICDYSHVSFDMVKEKLLEINPNYDVGLYAPYNMQMLIAI